MEQLSSDLIKNDFTPELNAGIQSARQNGIEIANLFNYLLTGYDCPLSLRNFLFKIFCYTKPGKVYAFSDPQIADYYGGATKNYISQLRKAYKEWLNGENDAGIRHFPFLSITEHAYDTKIKKQRPTEYCFSKDFYDIFEEILSDIHSHPKYKDSWLFAMKAVCDEHRHKRLLDIPGYIRPRPKKRERSPEKIVATMYLNVKRTTLRIVETQIKLGFAAADIEKDARKKLNEYLDQAMQQAMAVTPHIMPVKDDVYTGQMVKVPAAPKTDFAIWTSSINAYIADREDRPAIFIPRKWENRSEVRDYAATGFIPETGKLYTPGELRRHGGQSFVDSNGRNSDAGAQINSVLESRPTNGHGEILQAENALDNARKRFLEKRKNGGG
jgi:hypothetical protein